MLNIIKESKGEKKDVAEDEEEDEKKNDETEEIEYTLNNLTKIMAMMSNSKGAQRLIRMMHESRLNCLFLIIYRW